MEIALIKQFNSNNKKNGYNCTPGGDGRSGFTPTEETRKKISEAGKGRKHSEESIQKMRNAQKGRIITDEAKVKMSKAKAKDKSYFEENSTKRDTFKRTCKRMNWNFNDFEEIFADWYIRPDGERNKKYYYKLK